MEYVNGDDVTNNRHLAEAINVTREGSAPPGSTGYDEPNSAGPRVTDRDSAIFVAIDELEKIQTAPQETQKEIDRVLRKLRDAQHADNERRSRAMAHAHDTLQDLWVPPE